MRIKSGHKTAALLIVLCLLVISCEKLATPIGEIKSSPAKYENKTVVVYGEVVSGSKLPQSEKGSFVLRDGTGEIKVITDGSLPKTGEKKLVKGIVQSNFVIFGKHFGVVIKQQ
ncbi:MAG TPA: hypothetical protein PK747_00100 [Acidobacteriota bacterium]|jgi:cytochrome c-type biogenesis protein CcmE|nr:hypothetical protein [Acidobacteriota bacterium]HNT18220.1 hypothetical protein [Acidobacteriota bacterium]HPA27307.1 hypothetical protein [Acidobacteriota bacterium]HQO20746.1 hypothetical protein [Acidobacteriota bacterium]HQQ45795.1 hypothetical protein [Acidobacteriota bacterium]